MGEAVVRRHTLGENLIFTTAVVRPVRMCRSDHRYSIARQRAKRGRRWSVTCGFSCSGHRLSQRPELLGNRHRMPCAGKVRGARARCSDLTASTTKRPETFQSLAASISVLWRCPTLPQPIGCSTIGAAGLSFQVRNGGWAFPRCYDHHKFWCSTRFPALGVGVWVDRGLYSGCGCLFTVFCYPLCWVLFSVGPLVPVGSRAHCCASTSGLSTR